MKAPPLSRQYQHMIARRKKGLCVKCGKPAAKLKFRMGTSRISCMCPVCLAENRKRDRARNTVTLRLKEPRKDQELVGR